MIIDEFLSENQAFSASGASTNYYDFSVDRNVGIGNPLAVVVTVDVAADTASGDETYAFALQTDDNSSFSSATSIASITIDKATLVAGYQFALAIPADTSMERYLRLYATLGGTTPSITISAAPLPANWIPTNANYPKNYTTF